MHHQAFAEGTPHGAVHKVLILVRVGRNAHSRRAALEGIQGNTHNLIRAYGLVVVRATGGVLHDLQLFQILAA